MRQSQIKEIRSLTSEISEKLEFVNEYADIIYETHRDTNKMTRGEFEALRDKADKAYWWLVNSQHSLQEIQDIIDDGIKNIESEYGF